jgi:hypothetical protein
MGRTIQLTAAFDSVEDKILDPSEYDLRICILRTCCPLVQNFPGQLGESGEAGAATNKMIKSHHPGPQDSP